MSNEISNYYFCFFKKIHCSRRQEGFINLPFDLRMLNRELKLNLSIFSISDSKLMSDEDPENAKHEFAFDNPAFKGNLQIIQFSSALKNNHIKNK